MYILYNDKLKKPLIHPQVGLWITPDRAEADDLLRDFHNYVVAIGHEELVPHLVVRKVTEVSDDLSNP